MKKSINICEILLFVAFVILTPFLSNKITLLIAIPVFVLIYYFAKNIKIKNYALFIFIVSLIIRIISIIILKVEITDDYKTMYDASTSLIKNDLLFLNSFYFKTFSYQLGHVLYQAILLKIINKVIFLKMINSIITSLIVVFVYLISKKLFKETTAKIISLIYLLYLYPIYLNSVLTNQHIPALLSLVVIYLVLSKEKSIKLSIVVAISLGISNFLRTESIIIILGISIYYLINIQKDNYKRNIISISVLLFTYFLFNIFISNIILISPLHTKLDNKEPLWKFYCGLNYKYNGRYNEEDQSIFFSSNNKRNLLINRVKEENVKLPILILKKEVILWTQTNYDLRITNIINKDIYKYILWLNQGYLNIIILLFIVSIYPYKNIKNKKILLLKIIVGLYYGIYGLIEISPRYAYILHIFILLLLGIGIEKIIELKRSTSK